MFINKYILPLDVSNITAEEYFSQEDLMGRDIGRPKEMTTKVKK